MKEKVIKISAWASRKTGQVTVSITRADDKTIKFYHPGRINERTVAMMMYRMQQTGAVELVPFMSDGCTGCTAKAVTPPLFKDYMGTISVQAPDGLLRTVPVVVQAETLEDAKGTGIFEAHRIWPRSDGYRDHVCTLDEEEATHGKV